MGGCGRGCSRVYTVCCGCQRCPAPYQPRWVTGTLPGLRCPWFWGSLCPPLPRGAPSLRPAASSLFVLSVFTLAMVRQAGEWRCFGPRTHPPAATWVPAPNSQGSWFWLCSALGTRLAPAMEPLGAVPLHRCLGGVTSSHPSLKDGDGRGPSAQLVQAGGVSPTLTSGREFSPSPGLGQSQGPQTCSRSYQHLDPGGADAFQSL